jgi:rhodanese-related sulfurtransferase
VLLVAVLVALVVVVVIEIIDMVQDQYQIRMIDAIATFLISLMSLTIYFFFLFLIFPFFSTKLFRPRCSPTPEDAECAAIIRAVMHQVNEANRINPSPPPDDLDCVSGCMLPTIDRPKIPDLKCISGETLNACLINDDWKNRFSKLIIIDCRFDYEYEGGHITSAIHCPEPKDAITNFFKNPPLIDTKPVCMIFHCEFSKNRAPKMLRHLRSIDRKINEARYPYLFYPETYLLDGGYRKFYSKYSNHCVGKYTQMRNQQENGSNDDDDICEEALDQSRKSWKRHKSTDFSSVDFSAETFRRSSSSF